VAFFYAKGSEQHLDYQIFCILFANIGQNTVVKCAHEYERKMTAKTNQGTKKRPRLIKGPSKYITVTKARTDFEEPS
jgi:hypothetical protein